MEVFENEDFTEFDDVAWNQCGDGGRHVAKDRRGNKSMGTVRGINEFKAAAFHHMT